MWVFDAIKFFSSREHKINLITPESSYLAEAFRESKPKINIVTYDYNGIANQSLQDIETWTLALNTSDVAICTVHPPRNDFHCAVFAAHCIEKSKLKTILVTKTGTIVPEYKRDFYIPSRKVKTRVITIAEFAYRYLIDHYNIPSHMVRLIYQGIDLNRFSNKSPIEESKGKFDNNNKKFPVLAIIGYLEERKGQIYAIKALEKVIEQFPDSHLLIVGEGPDKRKLEKMTEEHNLGRKITFVPFTNEPEKIIERIDILLLPSLFKEGLPNVILEALAMGKPVIASDVGGISEVVQCDKTGFLIPTGEIDQLVRAISKICSNPELYQALSNNALHLITEKFDRNKQLIKYEHYFQELTNN